MEAEEEGEEEGAMEVAEGETDLTEGLAGVTMVVVASLEVATMEEPTLAETGEEVAGAGVAAGEATNQAAPTFSLHHGYFFQSFFALFGGFR